MLIDEIVRYPPDFPRDFPDLGTTARHYVEEKPVFVRWRKRILRGSQHMTVPPALKTTTSHFLRRYRR